MFDIKEKYTKYIQVHVELYIKLYIKYVQGA